MLSLLLIWGFFHARRKCNYFRWKSIVYYSGLTIKRTTIKTKTSQFIQWRTDPLTLQCHPQNSFLQSVRMNTPPWEVRLHRGHLSYIQTCGLLKDVKNCTVCIKFYWLQIKMLSWKPPSSDSKEGQLEFSLKYLKFSTKCYTNNIFPPPIVYILAQI